MSEPQETATEDLPLVLVVDDDDDTRHNLADILELNGYRVGQAATASELLAHRAWDDVSVVLLDRKLPDGSPQQLTPRLRELAPFAAVIIVTGYADVEGAITAVRSGATDYILKPVNAEALLASIRRAIEQKRAEREIVRLHRDLANSEQRYRALFESTLDGLMIFDDKQTILAANRAACQMVGIAVEALVGNSFTSLALKSLHSDQPVPWVEIFSSSGKEGEVRYDDGAALEYRAVKDFAPGLHLLSLRDVTDRKRAEERALQAQRLAAIGETMAALVHESRNALQRSKACLEMLTLDLEDRPEALKLVSRAQQAQDDLHRLYEEVRQWAAPIRLQFEACDVQKLWQKVWNDVCDARRGHSFVLKEHTSGGTVCEIDSFAMAQVFRNVFENAMDVSPTGSAVTVRCNEHTSDRSQKLTVTIQDQGPGLKPEQLQRIFEPFFTTKAKGTGLGMAIVQRIVHSHGGIILASSPGGARIEITLPKKHS